MLNTNQSGQERPETHDEATNRIAHLVEYSNQRAAFTNPNFSERYLKGELEIVLRFRVGEVGKQFVARLSRSRNICRLEEDGIGIPEIGIGGHNRLELGQHDSPHIDTFVQSVGEEQRPVFVDVVKCVESPEIQVPTMIGLGGVNSIGLGGVNRGYSSGRHALYYSSLNGFILVEGVRDGESGFFGRDFVVYNDELPSQMVESTSEIVDEVTSYDGDSFGDGLDRLDVIHELSRLRIALGRDFVWMGRNIGGELRVQIVEVLMGPMDFEHD